MKHPRHPAGFQTSDHVVHEMSSPRRLVVISGARRPFCGAEAGSADASSPALAAQGNSGLPPPEFNTGVAHPARVYDYWLGGKDNYAADRALGDTIIEAMPSTQFAARTSSAFLGRAVRYLAAEAGIRQFLDIGTDIPTASNTHEVAPGRRAGISDRLRGQRPLEVGLCTRSLRVLCQPRPVRSCQRVRIHSPPSSWRTRER